MPNRQVHIRPAERRGLATNGGQHLSDYKVLRQRSSDLHNRRISAAGTSARGRDLADGSRRMVHQFVAIGHVLHKLLNIISHFILCVLCVLCGKFRFKFIRRRNRSSGRMKTVICNYVKVFSASYFF